MSVSPDSPSAHAADPVFTERLDNGLTLLIEPMSAVGSAAFNLLVPCGSVYDPPGRSGTASVLSEWLFRGAGDRSSREFSGALDDLGLSYSSSVRTSHMAFGGATLADRLPQALDLFADLVLRPHLPDAEFAPSVENVALTLRSVEDEPQQKVFQELRRRCYDHPWGAPTDGKLTDLPQLTPDDVRAHRAACFRPNDCILAIAGNVDVETVRRTVHEAFGDWEMQIAPEVETTPSGPPVDHLHFDSQQTQIGLAYPSIPYRHPNYYAAWAAVSILSGGMSSRLFTEVREKRGLCYSVFASHHSLRTEARVLGYAGTLAERAQETLDVMLTELKRLGEGIEEFELARCRVRARSALVMQQESTTRRAGSLANGWVHLGRVVPLAEVSEKIDALTTDRILAHVHEHPPRNFTVMTIGPEPLTVPDEV